MVLPTFEPNAKPGDAFDAYTGGVNQGQTWMARSQEAQLRQQKIDADIENQPLEIARRQADILKAHADTTSALLMQEMRARAAVIAPQALAEFLDATQIPDHDAKAKALSVVQAKYDWLGNIPENKAFVQQIKDERARSEMDVITNLKLEQTKEMSKQRIDSQNQIDSANNATKLTVAGNEVQRKIDALASAQAHAKEIQSLKEAHDTEIQKMRDETRQRGQDVAADAKVEAAKISTNRIYKFQAIKNLRDAALLNGDTEGAALYSAQLDKENHIALSSGEAMMQITGTAPAKPTTMAAAATASKTPVVLKSWDEAAALPPGTPYIGPDGSHLIRGSK